MHEGGKAPALRRVLQVVQSLDYGGLERVVVNLARTLDKERFRCDVLCLRREGRFAEELRSFGCAVQSFEIGRGKNLGLGRRLADYIRRGGYSIVQSHDTTPLLYTAIAKIYFRRFLHIYTEHSGIYSCLPRHRVMTWAALSCVDHAVLVSKDLLSYYVKHFWPPKPKMSVIYNGLDFPAAPADASASVRAEFGISPGATVVGSAVRFYPQKGLRYLVQAMPAVLDRDPDVWFLLAGDGVERSLLEQLVDELGVRGRVRFTGYRTDVPRLIAAMDVYVLPSLWEGLPLALIEALMASRAVVATRVGGNPEVVVDGETGFLVPPAQSGALAERVSALVESGDLRRGVAERGGVAARSQFSLARMIDGYERLYDSFGP